MNGGHCVKNRPPGFVTVTVKRAAARGVRLRYPDRLLRIEPETPNFTTLYLLVIS